MCFGGGFCGAAQLGGVFDANNLSVSPFGLGVGNVNRLPGSIGIGLIDELLNHNHS